jgi:3,4-dihydroxy 2-butanone 4-phosphate synthase/GTP cyclohydrolase II
VISPIEEILDDIRAGKMIILVDDADRENEGDLVFPAEKITPEAINFMAKNGRGLICLALTPDRIDALGLPPMSAENTAHFETAFHVSIGAAKGITTGISAQDRATTIRTAVDPNSKPEDLSRPGHVFPLRAQSGGVLDIRKVPLTLCAWQG